MPRKWTREERKKNLREKYYQSRDKAFVTISFVVTIFVVLGLAITDSIYEISFQIIIGFLIVVAAIIFFLVAFGSTSHKSLAQVLAVIFIVISIVAGIVLAGSLIGLDRFVVNIIIGFVFLSMIAIAGFFIDMITWENN